MSEDNKILTLNLEDHGADLVTESASVPTTPTYRRPRPVSGDNVILIDQHDTDHGVHRNFSRYRKAHSEFGRRHSDSGCGHGDGGPRDDQLPMEHSGSLENTFVMVDTRAPENAIEAHKQYNNYLFGFKKWKSHVTSRPLADRSEVVQELYADLSKLKPVKVSTIRPSNLFYVLIIGWWLALLYLLVAFFMLLTFIGRHYAKFCLQMAKYYFWPFGKFVYLVHPPPAPHNSGTHSVSNDESEIDEKTTLLNGMTVKEAGPQRSSVCSRELWCRPQSYLWLILGTPLLLIAHGTVAFLTWFFVITIPIAKVNLKSITHILWLPPESLAVGDSGQMMTHPSHSRTEIIMYTHQSMNIYYYKYTVDGMNVILANLLVFVALSLVIGYSDEENVHTSGVLKCILSIFAIVPLTYYIGMAIISISAQSTFAIGAVLNATFGSLVELILYVVAMAKGKNVGTDCYNELVRSALTGTLVGSVLFIPGICMVVGGLKYRSQSFNPKSASVTALLLFVSIAGVFAPTLFSKIFGDMVCSKCMANGTVIEGNMSEYSLQCSDCHQSLIGLGNDKTLYKSHIEPLVYACAIILPIAYIIGVIFTLKTHTSYVYDEFYEQQENEGKGGGAHGAPQWSRLKSIFILLSSAILIALCADIITNNIQHLMGASGISEYFIGVTLIGMLPELPEIVNGIQFSMQLNNVNLGIEIGTNTAIQVCLIQVPVLILINLIHPFNFVLIFNDIHLWAVIFSVIVINYIFQDGKSDYFQGTALVAIYLMLMCMYFFAPTPENAKC